MIVLVSGGRDFVDFDHLAETLDALHQQRPFSLLINGDALGSDYLSTVWAESRNIPVVRYPADWEKHNTKAGPIRNQQMLDEGTPDLVVIFPGGRGTNDMLKRSRERNVEIHIA